MRRSFVSLMFASLLIFQGNAVCQEIGYDVPYVPTKHEVVAEMLRMAEVGKDDVLYDLGCGDGRIVITAAKEMGARGIGIDINPRRIEESMANAIKSKVTNRVKFIEQDLFKADLSEATVVSLYLLTAVNLKLRPMLFSQLKPGTRLVSHNYGMGKWNPDQTSRVRTAQDDHTVYYWVIPANVTGTWEWTMPSGMEKKRYKLKLDQKFQNVAGTVSASVSKKPVKNLKLTGDILQFSFVQKIDGQLITMQFEGKVKGDSIKGVVVTNGGAMSGEYSWNAKRDPSTIKPIDNF